MSKETAWKWIEDHRDELAEVSDEVWGFAEYGLLEEKRRIMNYLFANQEKPSPTGEVDPHLARIGKDVELERTTIGWIAVEELTGKKSTEVKF
ncbi:MAG: hypothetical protein WC941_02200 [Candidatus Bathyarchaeia archaeon]